MAIFSTSISQEIFYEHSNLVKGYMLCFFISHIPISVEDCPVRVHWFLPYHDFKLNIVDLLVFLSHGPCSKL